MKNGFERLNPKWLLESFYVCERFSILGLRLFSRHVKYFHNIWVLRLLCFCVVVDVGVYSMGRIRGLVTL